MTQISPLAQNPYAMFKMPSAADTNKTAQTPTQPVNSIDNTKQEAVPQATVASKGGSKKALAAVIVAAAAVIGGLAYGVKSGKLDIESIKTKIPYFGEKYKEKLAQEAAKKAAEEAAKKAAEEAAKEAAKNMRKTDANFFTTVFSLGLIAKGFAKHMASKEPDLETDAAKIAFENEQYMKDIELPILYEEAASYKDNYSQSITAAIEKLQVPKNYMMSRYQAAMELYQTIAKENSVEVWPQTNLRKSQVVYNELVGTLTHYTFDKSGKLSEKIVYTDGHPIQIEAYKDEKLVAKARFMKKDSLSEPYMSHLFKYDPNTGNISGTLVFNQNGDTISYLARNRDGKLNKVFNIDPETKNIKAVCLSDKEGKKCTRKYFYDEEGNIEEAYFAKTKDMPKRVYEFEDGIASAVRFYSDNSNNVSVRVPFEKQN